MWWTCGSAGDWCSLRSMWGPRNLVARAARAAEYGSAGVRHRLIRAAVVRTAAPQLTTIFERPALRVTLLDDAALKAWRTNWQAGNECFDWVELGARYGRRWSRVEAAFWHGELLCGLFYGSISRGRHVIRIDCLEGRAGPHPLKRMIAPMAAQVGALYAQAYESSVLRFHRPIPGAIPVYQALGFLYTPPSKGHPGYCETNV